MSNPTCLVTLWMLSCTHLRSQENLKKVDFSLAPLTFVIWTPRYALNLGVKFALKKFHFFYLLVLPKKWPSLPHPSAASNRCLNVTKASLFILPSASSMAALVGSTEQWICLLNSLSKHFSSNTSMESRLEGWDAKAAQNHCHIAHYVLQYNADLVNFLRQQSIVH